MLRNLTPCRVDVQMGAVFRSSLPKNDGSIASIRQDIAWQLRCPRETKLMLYLPDYTDPRRKHCSLSPL